MNHNPSDPLSGGHGHDSVGMHPGMPNGGGPPGGPTSQNNPLGGAGGGGPGGGGGGGGGPGGGGGGGGGGHGPGMIGPGCVPGNGLGGGGMGIGVPGGIFPSSGGPGGGAMCGGCGRKITDRYLLKAMDSYWHTTCLKCSCCGITLADLANSCYAKGGMILCKQDYIRIFGSSGLCTSCGQTIPASEFVMRTQGNVYHLKCFVCAKCHNQLVPGDRYNVVNGNLLCEQDCHKYLKSAITTGPPGRKGKLNRQEARQNKMAKAAAMCQNMDLNQGAYI